MPENIWKWWLEETPEALYGALRPRTPSRGYTDYWRRQQSGVRQDYMGVLGQQAMGGQPPSLDYSTYLQNYPWMQRWQQMGPRERGEYPSQYAPSLRWNI